MIIFNQEPFRSASQSKEQRWAPRIKRQSPWQRSRWDQVWPGSDQVPKMTRPVLIWPLLGSPNISISSHTGIPRWCSLNPRPSTNWRKLRTSLSLLQGNPSYQLTGIELQVNDLYKSAHRNAPMVLAEPKTIHNLKDLENKFVTPSGEPDKGAYRWETQRDTWLWRVVHDICCVSKL